MQIKACVAVLAVLGLLVSCAQLDPHPMDMTQAVQSAKTRADHEALAKHYEDMAQAIREKMQKQKKLLEQYETESYHYDGQAEDEKAHSRALIRFYEQAAEPNMNMAASHRKMATEAK
jgi:uncharacterized protein YyaL (SSP411 family)